MSELWKKVIKIIENKPAFGFGAKSILLALWTFNKSQSPGLSWTNITVIKAISKLEVFHTRHGRSRLCLAPSHGNYLQKCIQVLFARQQKIDQSGCTFTFNLLTCFDSNKAFILKTKYQRAQQQNEF
jgi:hypothetical protein